MSHRYTFRSRPKARPEATVGGNGSQYRFQVLDDGLIRYEYAADGYFEDRASTFAMFREQPVPAFRVVDNDNGLQIITSKLHLFYDKLPFSSSGLRAQIKGYVSNSASLWRYGYHLDQHVYALGGTVRTLDRIDGRIDLGMGVISKNGYAEIDDSDSMLFTQDGWISGRRPAQNGQRIDGYLFGYGHAYREAIKAFYRISGPQPVLPRWALGNWWSKNFKYSAESYLELVDQFRENSIPLSVAVLDMKWHWVEEERVRQAGATGWTGYSWNTELFNDPKQFVKDMHERLLKVTCCDHPSEGIAVYEDSYEEVCKAVEQDPSLGEAVPFDIASKPYLNAYFDVVLKKLEDDGIDFFWQDWQQGPFSSMPGCDPLWVLNHYHYLNMQKDNRRPFIFSRYAGPGSHRYPIGFSGDTIITWESLAFQPEFTATASNIGFSWWSNGGFRDGVRDDELMTRWTQLGVFSPILRLHSGNSIWISKEPWKFPSEPHAAQASALRMRHRLVPYIYSMNIRAARDAEPLVQPLYWECPKRSEAYWYKSTFLFGSELFVAPSITRRDPVTLRSKTKVWLPPGRHVDLFSGIVYKGDRQVTLHRRTDEIAAFAHEGSLIPLDGADVPAFGCPQPSHLELIVIVGADGAFELFEDSGCGSSLEDIPLATTRIHWNQGEGTLTITPPEANLDALPLERQWTVTFLGYEHGNAAQPDVQVGDGMAVAEVRQAARGMQVLLSPAASSRKLVLALGVRDPQLRANRVNSFLATRLDEAQTAYRVKKVAWASISGEPFNDYGLRLGSSEIGLARIISELTAMELEGDLLSALVEVLCANE